MRVLVLNCGSSSLKYKLFNIPNGGVLASGQAERIGKNGAIFRHEVNGRMFLPDVPLPSHHNAIESLLGFLAERNVETNTAGIRGIGHRVVHGAERFKASVLIDAKVGEALEDCKKLAPLHNPPNLAGIDVCAKLLPGLPQVAVFDTAFHQTIPDYAYTYAIPYRFYTNEHVRRYGFHGISHRYVALRGSKILKKCPEDLRMITCHLGNGSSLCAVANGKSADTSMGFTPLSGVVMGTRCGDIDPALVPFLAAKENLSNAEVVEMLNHESGVLGISGISLDFRDLEEAANKKNPRARLALNAFAYSVARGVASLLPALGGGIDALIFTAGIGENSLMIRRLICGFLSCIGIVLDDDKNNGGITEGEISAPSSSSKILIVPTDEEMMIAKETHMILQSKK